MRYVPKHRELRLGIDLIAVIGNPTQVNIKPYAGGLIVTAEGHPDLDPLDELRTVRKFGVVRVNPTGPLAAALVEGYYKYTLVTPGQVLAMPETKED